MKSISNGNPQVTIRVEKYKTPQHLIFGVYKGVRHWQRFTSTEGNNDPFWVEDTSERHGRAVSGKRIRWLENIRRDRKKYQKVVRFTRTQNDDRGKEVIQALTEAHAKGENDLVQQYLTNLQRHVNSLSLAYRDSAAQSIWDALPRFDPERVPTTKWLIDSFLAEGTIQLIFGEPGTFKTTLCFCAAKAVACGIDFLGMKTRPRRVLYIDFENPLGVIQARSIDLGLDLPRNPNLVVWNRFSKDFVLHPGHPLLVDLVRQCIAETGHGPWIIFDSWSSLLRPGDGGETTGQIAPVYSQFRRLTDLGATVSVLDHAKKYDSGIIYGGSDKVAKSDTIHKLQVFENPVRSHNPIVKVESTLKRFSPAGVGGFAFEVRSQQDKKGTWHISDLLRAADPAELAAERKRQILRDLIRTNPDAGQETLADMASKVGLPRDQAIKTLKDRTSKDWLVSTGRRGRQCYQLL